MIESRKPFLSPALACLGLAAVGAAQQQPFRGWRSDFQVTSDVPGELLALEAGRLTGDLRLDVLMRTRETLAIVVGPAMFESYLPFGAGATAAAVVPRAAGDRVAACDAAGLAMWCWSQVLDGQVECRISDDPLWRGATELRVAPHPDGQVIVARSQNGDVLARGLWDHVQFTPLAPLVFEGPVRDFAVLDFCGDPAPEYAVVTPSGLRVFGSAGEPIAGAAWPQFGGGERVRRIPGDPGAERLAYLFTSSYGTFLTVLRHGLSEPCHRLPGPIADWNLGDWDLDGKLDMLLTARDQPTTFVLYRDRIPGSERTFDLDVGDVWAIPHGREDAKRAPSGMPHLFSRVALGDFDFDGDLDLFGSASRSESGFELSLVRGDRRDDRAQRPWIGGCAYDPSLGAFDCPVTPVFDDSTGEHVANRFEFEFLVAAATAEAAGSAPTHLEVLVYLQDDFTQFHSSSSAPYYVDASPAASELFALPCAALPCEFVPSFEVPILGRDDARLVYHFAVSPVRVVNGHITRRWPTEIALHRRMPELNSALAPLLAPERIDLAPSWSTESAAGAGGTRQGQRAPRTGSVGAAASGGSLPLSSWALSGGVNERPVVRPTRPGERPRGGG